MHKNVGDYLAVSSPFGTETVNVRHVYEYPNGGFAYGFWSTKAGRNGLQGCMCSECEPLKKEREARGERYIGDVKRDVLIQL